jgi:Domain of unknown function (DUF5666)
MPVQVRSFFVLLLLLAACGSGAGAPELVGEDDPQLPDAAAMAAPAGQQAANVGVPGPPPPAALSQGPIEVLGSATIQVATVQYAVVTGQTIVRRGGVPVSLSELKQGDSAAVKGGPTADGSVVAQVIDVLLVPRPLPKLVILKGPVTAGSDSVTVVGQAVRVDANTLILRGGHTIVPVSSLRNGEPIQMTCRPGADGSLLAMVIYAPL